MRFYKTTRTIHIFSPPILAVIALTLLLTGCHKQAAQQGEGYDSMEEGGAPSQSQTEAQAQKEAAAAQAAAEQNPDLPTKEVPSDFPQDLVYTGAAVTHVRRPHGALREIMFDTSTPMDKLSQFYDKEALQKKGYTVTSTLKIAIRHIEEVDFQKDGRQHSVKIYPSDEHKGQMTIDVLYEPPTKINPEFAEPTETWDIIGPGEVAQNKSQH